MIIITRYYAETRRHLHSVMSMKSIYEPFLPRNRLICIRVSHVGEIAIKINTSHQFVYPYPRLISTSCKKSCNFRRRMYRNAMHLARRIKSPETRLAPPLSLSLLSVKGGRHRREKKVQWLCIISRTFPPAMRARTSSRTEFMRSNKHVRAISSFFVIAARGPAGLICRVPVRDHLPPEKSYLLTVHR